MNLTLTKGLDTKDADQIRGEFISSHFLRQRMIKILREKIDTCNTAMRDLSKYEQASWPLYQADRLGQIRAYEEIISLFSK